MLVIAHSLSRSDSVAATPEKARESLTTFMELVPRLSDVSTVESYGDGIYRIILNKLGGTVGMWSYGVHVAFDLRLELEGDRVVATSLPRDPHDSWIGDGILLGSYNSETRLVPHEEGVTLEHAVDLRIDLPIPSFFALVPRPLMQGVADMIIQQKAAVMLDEMLGLLRKHVTS